MWKVSLWEPVLQFFFSQSGDTFLCHAYLGLLRGELAFEDTDHHWKGNIGLEGIALRQASEPVSKIPPMSFITKLGAVSNWSGSVFIRIHDVKHLHHLWNHFV